MINKLKHLNIYRLTIAFLGTFFAIFLLNGLFTIFYVSRNFTITDPAPETFDTPFIILQIVASLIILLVLPVFIYRHRFKRPSLTSKTSLGWLIGTIFLCSFLLGLFYEPIVRYLPFFLFILPNMLIPLALLSCPLAVWVSLDLGKKVYVPLFLYYALCLSVMLGLPLMLSRSLELDEALIIIGIMGISTLVIHVLILRKRYNGKTAYVQPKLLSSTGLKKIGFKLCLIFLGALLLLGIYKIFNNDWRPSPEYKELTQQEKALGLPKPDHRSSSDSGCQWDSWDETTNCNRKITLSYNDITKVGLIRDRIVANGWHETSYDEHIGSDRQEGALSASQISQGMMPKAASHTSYHFSSKAGNEGNLCVSMIAWSHGDERNPVDPLLTVSLYGKTHGC